VKPQTWRRLRQLSQWLALGLFLALFIFAPPPSAWSDLFYRLDPLVVLTATLAGRTLIVGLAWAGLTLLLTLVFGRAWCGWLCPLGTVLEWLSPKRRRPQRKEGRFPKPPEGWRKIKYVLLFVILFAALLGNQTLLFLDPITIMTRTMAAALWPMLGYGVSQVEAAFYRLEFLWGPLDAVHQAIIYPLFQDMRPVFSQAGPIFLFFALIVALNGWAERFWCRYLCPLGGLLGLLSKLALARREVGAECVACVLCTQNCPTGTIDPAQGYRSDPAECTVCYDCLVSCPRQGIAFRWPTPDWRPAVWQTYDPTRRTVLAGLGAAGVGFALAGVEPVVKRQPATLIRPPGATLTGFESLCIRCGECVRVCPTQGLQPALFEAGWQNLLTPRLVPRLGYCSYNCHACGQVCPTGAIPNLTLEAKQQTVAGLARIDRDRCLPWAYNTPCIVCEEACPLPDKAIRLEEAETVNAQGERMTLQRPVMIRERCIGCGICEYQCPLAGEAAIRVFTPMES
jgi:polyferredoxin